MIMRFGLVSEAVQGSIPVISLAPELVKGVKVKVNSQPRSIRETETPLFHDQPVPH